MMPNNNIDDLEMPAIMGKNELEMTLQKMILLNEKKEEYNFSKVRTMH